MKPEDIEGVRVERDFLSTATKMAVKLPFDRADPLYSEKKHDFVTRLAELEFKNPEGRKTVNFTFNGR